MKTQQIVCKKVPILMTCFDLGTFLGTCVFPLKIP